MLVTAEKDVEHLHALGHHRVGVVVLAVAAGIADREMIDAEFPRAFVVKIALEPLVNFLRRVDADNGKVRVAVLERIVFGLPALGTVVGIAPAELFAEELRRLRVEAPYRVAVVPEAAVVVVAKGHLHGHALGYALPALHRAVPLHLVLTAVGIVAAGQDEGGVGILLKDAFDEIVKNGVIRRVERRALLLVGEADELEFSDLFGRGHEREDLAPVHAVAAGVFIGGPGAKTGELSPVHHAAVDIAHELAANGVGAREPVVRAVLSVKNVALRYRYIGPPRDGHGRRRVARQRKHDMVGSKARTAERFF